MASRTSHHSPGRLSMLTVRGQRLRVAVRDGEPGTPPLLLCNGISATLEVLQPFVDALDSRRGIIRFDLPGIGGSPVPLVPYHLATLPGMLTSLLDQLGHPQADVMGFSWGGGLAQQLALLRPSRVRRLVLAATGTGALMVPAAPQALWHLMTLQLHPDRGHVSRVAGEIYGGTMRTDPERAGDLLYPSGPSGPVRGYYYQLLASVGWTSLPALPLLRQPTLLLAGADDPLVPVVNAQIMHRLIAGSQLHVYAGGHLELIAEPGRLAPVVETFLSAGTAAAPVQEGKERT